MARERNRSIINELTRLHKQHLDGRLPVYDGRKGMFTAAALPFKTKEFVVKVSNPERGHQGYDVFHFSYVVVIYVSLVLILLFFREKEYKVTIKEVAKLDLYNLQQFLAGRQRELPQDTIQALDIALRETPTAK